jgi:apolipoprotein N-acyltransferase
MDSKLNPYAVAAPCLAISATMFFLGTGLNPLWICTWLAAIPALWLAPRVSKGYAFFVAASAYALGGLNLWSYSRQVLPTVIVISLLLFGACLFGLAVLLFRGRMLHRKIWQAVLILPSFWVVVDYLISKISIHGTFGNIAYSQMNFLPIVQVASVTGIWGISFCIFLFAAAIAALFSAAPWSEKISGAIVASVFLLFVFAYGAWRLAATPKETANVKVALIASSAKGNFFAPNPEQLHAVPALCGRDETASRTRNSADHYA